MSSGRLGWSLAGTIVLVGIIFVIFRLQPRHSCGEQLALRTKKIELTGQIGLALASAAEAEKSAVLAITDEQSVAFAQQARAATSTAEQARAALDQLLQIEGTSKEKDLLLQFATSSYSFIATGCIDTVPRGLTLSWASDVTSRVRSVSDRSQHAKRDTLEGRQQT